MKIYKSCILIMLSTLLITNVFSKEKDEENVFKQTIKKEFSVGQNATFDVTNKYGKIEIVEGTSDKIKFEITYEIKANKKSVFEMLKNSFKMELSNNHNSVQVNTYFEPYRNTSKLTNISRTINYFVELPKNCNLVLNNKYGNVDIQSTIGNTNLEVKYGNVNIQNIFGNANLEVKYGHLFLQEITGTDNNITVGYGKLFVEKFKNANIYVSYGRLTINQCNKANIQAKYSPISIQKAEDLNLLSSYETVDINEVNNLNVSEHKYSNFKINKLYGDLIFGSLSYSKLNVNYVAPSTKSINIIAKYTPIRICLDQNTEFKGKLNLKYSKLIKNFDLAFRNLETESNSFKADFQTNKANEDSLNINITNSYNTVTLDY